MYVDTVTTFFQNFNQKINDPRWLLTLLLLKSQVQLYLRIIVSKSLESTSRYVDKVTIWKK